MKDKINEKILKDAQFRKGLSIAFFNSTNSAISLVSNWKYRSKKDAIKEVVKLREFFLKEHAKYYANTIAMVGLTYNPKEVIKRMKMTKTLEELGSLWITLSEDERRDETIVKVKNELKKKYEETSN